MSRRFRRRAIAVVAFGGALCGASQTVGAMHLSQGVLVDQPGLVLMVDGKDRNASVSLTVNTRGRGGVLDFGFMNGDAFSSLGRQWCGDINSVFAGGATIDFAVRSKGTDNRLGTPDDQIFRLSDPAGYASQRYASPIAGWKSVNPGIDETYYRNLTLFWDVNQDGITDLKVMLQAHKRADGLHFSPSATPVPLPAAVWLLGGGLAGLAVVARRRPARSSA